MKDFEPQLVSVRSVLYMIAWTIGCATSMTIYSDLPVWALLSMLIVFLMGLPLIIVFSMSMDEKDFETEQVKGTTTLK